MRACTINSTGSWGRAEVTKDCGLIPYLLHKNFNFDTVTVAYNVEKKVIEYAEKYTPGMKFESLPEDTIQARINYIKTHAVEIDLLILYGAFPAYIFIADTYKKIRPDGKIYLSSDMNIAWADRIPHDSPSYKNFLDNCDVIAASCRNTQKYLSAKWHVPVNLIRNPFYNFDKISFDNLFTEKENIILTVGRIGNFEKANHIMLEAFAKCADNLPSWKMRLVGGVDEKFKPYIKNFFERNPKLKEKIIFVGLVDNRAKLMEEYKRAKIFCITSPKEGGTPNVAGEALFSGCYMITSAIDGRDDMTDSGQCGKIFPVGNIDALSKIFLEVCNDENLLLQGGKHAADYAREQFDADHVVARLHYLLYGGE